MTQWDAFGICSEAVLVTNPTAGTVGTGPGDVPPAGSVFNYVHYGNSGFGFAGSAAPSGRDDAITVRFLTPFGDIPLYTTRSNAGQRADVSYFDPFTTV